MPKKCELCGGVNVWTIVGKSGPEEYCRDCYILCDCGERYHRKQEEKCPFCGGPRPTESDDYRVARWMHLVRENVSDTPQLIQNIGHIGPAGRAAIPLLRQLYRKHGKYNWDGCAAFDALREHEQYNPPPRRSLLRRMLRRAVVGRED